MKKVYISIPITGKHLNAQKTLANTMKKALSAMGYIAISPFDVVNDDNAPTSVAMGKCIMALLECDAVYFMTGWHKSKGCMTEFDTARNYGMEMMFQ
jgi:hypothetical protein